jgi:hypothetical protein
MTDECVVKRVKEAISERERNECEVRGRVFECVKEMSKDFG